MIPAIIYQDELIRRLEPYCILMGYRGSIAHDTYEENVLHDDKDLMGIYVPPEETTFGLQKMDTVERAIPEKLSQKRTVVWDIVYYSLPKYLSLVLKQNPNVLSLLWLEERFYLKRTKWGQRLIDSRQALLSKQCYQSFIGYSRGQLHRMTHHGPTGRMGAKRKELVEKVGYDSKNAGHLIRLLKMGIEALTLGELIVARPDNNMLLEIKRGEWPLQKVLDYADSLFRLIDEALVKSPLSAKVDFDFANNLCMGIMREFYREKEA